MLSVYCQFDESGRSDPKAPTFTLTEFYDIGDSEDVGLTVDDVQIIERRASEAQANGAILIDTCGVLWALKGTEATVLYDYRHLLG